MEAKTELLLWTLMVLIFSTLILNAIYRLENGRLLKLAESSAFGALAREAGVFVLMVGIPFVALITGAAGLDLMAMGADVSVAGADRIAGFTFLDWVRGIGISIAVVVSILLVLWLGNRNAPHGQPWGVGWLGLREAIYNEVHWTFYRATPTLWLNDPYWGVIVGAALVLLEWASHPDAREWLQSIEGRQFVTLRLACLLSSSFLYLAAHNLWLMIVVNLIIQWAGSRLLSRMHPTREHIDLTGL
jgi:hypothetical protein